MSEARGVPDWLGPARTGPPDPGVRERGAPHPGRADPYTWLRRRADPRVTAFLAQENEAADRALAVTEEMRRVLYAEMRARIRETDRSVPVRVGDYYYYQRTEEGKPYRIWARSHRAPDGEEDVLLDENALAAEHDFFQVGPLEVSPDHRWLAYGFDATGDENYTVVFKDLTTGEFSAERIERCGEDIAWAEDSRTLVYVARDRAMRPHRVYRHDLGSDPASDVCMFEEPHPGFHIDMRKSRSRRFILIESCSAITGETWLIDAHRPDRDAVCFQERRRGVEYDLTDTGHSMLVRTNDRALNFRVFEAAETAEGFEQDRSKWVERVPHRTKVMLEAVEAFRDFVVRVEREEGLRQITIGSSVGASDAVRIALPEPVCVLNLEWNPEFGADRLRYSYSSPVTPHTVCEYDPSTGGSEVLKRLEVSGYQPERYTVERLTAVADDGVEVPMTTLRRRDLAASTPHPTLLTAYGAYGISYEPGFVSHVFSLVDRGFVFAIAHVRGGGEFGESWHEQGKMLDKRRTFTDFVTCAEHLIERGWTRPDLLAIQGRSAGGLLVGAVLNLRPDLFQAAVAGVPFVDVLSTMLDPSIPLTVIEYEEWGDPRDVRYYEYIGSYSPFDNVRRTAYPHMLVTAGLHDPRVQFWEPARWVARLRELRTDDRLLLLKTDTGAGHLGPSDRFAWLAERAVEYAFLLHAVTPDRVVAELG